MTITFVMLNFRLAYWWHYARQRKILNRLTNNSANEFRFDPDSYKTMEMAFWFTETKLQWILLICRIEMNLYTPPWNSGFSKFWNPVTVHWYSLFCGNYLLSPYVEIKQKSVINSFQLYLQIWKKLEILKIMKRNHYKNSKVLTHSIFSV